MTSITANCRDQLTAEDFRAIGVTLAKDPQKMASLTALLTNLLRVTRRWKASSFSVPCSNLQNAWVCRRDSIFTC